MKSTLPARFGIVVRRHRQARGWSQEAFADRAGLSRSFSGDVERGQAIPSLDTLLKIAEALGLAPSAMLAEAERPPRRGDCGGGAAPRRTARPAS